MTNWIPDIPAGKGPMYARLADKIANDIASGTLTAGAKLPPQRDLAYDLGITVGTVGRAYALVREQGLVSGEVGRGTYVLGSQPETALHEHPRAVQETAVVAPRFESARSRPSPETGIAWTQVAVSAPEQAFGGTRLPIPPQNAIRLDSTSAPEIGQAEVIRELLDQITREAPQEIASYTRTVPDSWRLAGQRWLSRSGWQPSETTIVPTNGAQAAIMAIVGAVTAPGDRIAFEDLTYSSIARGTALSGRPAVHVARDDEGPLPEDLARVCAQKHPRVLFLMPTVHNPTLGTMGEERRKEIVAIAREYNLWIIEDEVYGTLRQTALPPLSALAPERTFHVGSLSKAVTAGVRGGWVSSPPSHAQRLYTAHKMLTGGISFLLAELSARLILSGAARTFQERVRKEIAARYHLSQTYLAGYEVESAPDTPFLWLKLPEPWMPGTFKAAAASAGVLIDDEDEFKSGRSNTVYHRVRVGTSNPHSREELARGLNTLRQLLADPGACYDSFE